MEEIVRTMSEEEFQKELETIKANLSEMRMQERSRYEILQFLIGWVSAPTSRVHLPEQLEQIFNLPE